MPISFATIFGYAFEVFGFVFVLYPVAFVIETEFREPGKDSLAIFRIGNSRLLRPPEEGGDVLSGSDFPVYSFLKNNTFYAGKWPFNTRAVLLDRELPTAEFPCLPAVFLFLQ